MSVLRALHERGVLGINRRNSQFTLRWNPRRLYPLVDDKLATKRLCEAAGIPTPRLLAVAEHHFQVRTLPERLEGLNAFALKPARGAMGNGIIVIVEREGDRLLRAGGRWIAMQDMLYHAASIISGLYSLSGHSDVAVLEEKLTVHPELAEVSSDGVPDVRVIVYRGTPVMCMTRLPTRRSGGRANLHQGALGAGIELTTGRTCHAVQYNRPVRRHPDSGRPLLGRTIPDFDVVLDIAVRACDQTGLGYVGADVVVDAARGPLILELNARPGLAVQVANRAGLLPRLRAVDAAFREGRTPAERIAVGREIARNADAGAMA